ncbi:MAG: hypothetical protein CR991_05240 [Proteobacteria bacterium]|nr:MAG: hypothetical protein CR991_05240 [Pseudomonadota bacterium]
MKKQITWVLAGLSSFLISLAALAPLPVLVQQITRIAPEVKFAGVSGTLWHGKVQRLHTSKIQVDNLYWNFRPSWLLGGYLGADVNAKVQTAIQVKGQCGISFLTQVKCAPLTLNSSARELIKQIPEANELGMQAQGDISGDFRQIVWNRKDLPQIEGDINWRDGSVIAPIVGPLNLGGEYKVRIRESNELDQAMKLGLESNETAIVLDGHVDVMDNHDYQLEIFLKPSGEAPPSVGNVLGLLGSQQSDGSVRLEQRGTLPWPSSDNTQAEQ